MGWPDGYLYFRIGEPGMGGYPGETGVVELL